MATLESIERTKSMVRAGRLEAGPSFMSTPNELLMEICNGCGAANAKFDFVPDTIYGMRITDTCHIHDEDYHTGSSNEDKEAADLRMKNNILSTIERERSFVRRMIKPLMRLRAKLYFKAVSDYGGTAFWDGK